MTDIMTESCVPLKISLTSLTTRIYPYIRCTSFFLRERRLLSSPKRAANTEYGSRRLQADASEWSQAGSPVYFLPSFSKGMFSFHFSWFRNFWIQKHSEMWILSLIFLKRVLHPQKNMLKTPKRPFPSEWVFKVVRWQRSCWVNGFNCSYFELKWKEFGMDRLAHFTSLPAQDAVSWLFSDSVEVVVRMIMSALSVLVQLLCCCSKKFLLFFPPPNLPLCKL